MDTEIFVFAVGSIASFWPLYWGLSKLKSMSVSRSTATIANTISSSAKVAFLNLLREETAKRASAALRDALTEARSSMPATDRAIVLRSSTRESLDEAVELVRHLFSDAIQSSYRAVAIEICGANRLTLKKVAQDVDTIIVALDRSLEPGHSHTKTKPAIKQQPAFAWPAILQAFRSKKKGERSNDDEIRTAAHLGYKGGQSPA